MPNDCFLGPLDNFQVITGSNGSGKVIDQLCIRCHSNTELLNRLLKNKIILDSSADNIHQADCSLSNFGSNWLLRSSCPCNDSVERQITFANRQVKSHDEIWLE